MASKVSISMSAFNSNSIAFMKPAASGEGRIIFFVGHDDEKSRVEVID